MSKCRMCNAELKWIVTRAGRKMPVDAEKIRFVPDGSGKETFVTEKGDVITGKRTEEWHFGEIGYISHFSTCPYANKFRKGRK